MDIPVSVFQLKKLCDQESQRYALGGIKFESRREGASAVATDGRRLMALEWQGSNQSGQQDGEQEGESPALMGEFILPLAACEALSRTKGAETVRVIDLSDSRVTVRGLRNGCEADLHATPIEGKFPKWREVLDPPACGEAASIKVNPRYVANVMAAAAEFLESSGEPSQVEVIVIGPDKPLMVRGEAESDGQVTARKCRAAIMPLFDDRAAADQDAAKQENENQKQQTDSALEALRFLQRLGTERGQIVSSADCSPSELAQAAACGRLFVDPDGLGYVLRPSPAQS